MPISSSRGNTSCTPRSIRPSVVASVLRSRTPPAARSVPATPPSRPSITLSVRRKRSSRVRPAPSAARMAISRCLRDGSREEEIGDVDAGDEQHEPGRDGQHEQCRLDRCDDPVLRRHELVRDGLRGVAHLSEDGAGFRGRGLPGDPVGQPSHQGTARGRGPAHRNPELHLLIGEHEAPGHDADHGVDLRLWIRRKSVREREALTDDPGIAAEVALPRGVTEHNRGISARDFFGGVEPASEERRNPECLEHARPDPHALKARRTFRARSSSSARGRR